MLLRRIGSADHSLVREIYADAIESQAPGLYSPDQVRAWAALAWLPGILDRTLLEGKGWISGYDAAFAVREPRDRLSLLYCRGRASRQGHGRALLDQIEADARHEGVERLRTEASQLSRPLLERCGWSVQAPEIISIGSVLFERYRMDKWLLQERN